jgi:hypothetical protein
MKRNSMILWATFVVVASLVLLLIWVSKREGEHRIFRNTMRENGIVLENQTNLPIQNPDGLGRWMLYGDIITLRQGGTVTRISEVDGKYLVWYEPRFLSNEEPQYRGALFLWDSGNYDDTLQRQRSVRVAASNALVRIQKEVK